MTWQRLVVGQAVLVKRIVGLPGERIAFTEGQVWSTASRSTSLASPKRQPWNVRDVQLGPQEYDVIGDNRGMLSHLHDFGRAARQRIAGRVVH